MQSMKPAKALAVVYVFAVHCKSNGQQVLKDDKAVGIKCGLICNAVLSEIYHHNFGEKYYLHPQGST